MRAYMLYIPYRIDGGTHGTAEMVGVGGMNFSLGVETGSIENPSSA